jgi:hypothetical protein
MPDNSTDRFFERVHADPSVLLDAIDEGLASVDPLDLPMVVLGDKPARAVKTGRPFHAIMDAMLAGRVAELRVVVCDVGQYCAQSRKYKNTIDLMKAVNDSLVSSAFHVPLPIATVAAYCVQSLFLDRLCACEGAA